MRQYIEDKIGRDYLIPLVGGPWNKFEDIDFDKLPDQFVLKCTHDSGGLVICTDKSTLNFEEAKNKIKKASIIIIIGLEESGLINKCRLRLLRKIYG